jgi:hypothetical protein
MREIIVKLYKYSELSDRAKERARDWYRGNGIDYSWSGEAADSLKAFAGALPIKLWDYEYGERGRSYFRFDVTNENTEDLTGLRLRTWFINNFWNVIEKGKFYSTAGTYDAAGKYQYKKRYSKMTPEVSCPFTGYCADEDIIDPIRKLIFNYRPGAYDAVTFRDVVKDCFDSFADSVAADIEYQNSDEAVAETIDANEYEFDENGDRA